MEKLILQITEVVGSSLCVASEDGDKVYEQIARAFRDDQKVELSFLNVESLTSAFLNAAVGRLYGEFSEEQIKKNLSVRDIHPDDVALLKRVVDTAKLYFSDPETMEAIRRHVLGESDDAEYNA